MKLRYIPTLIFLSSFLTSYAWSCEGSTLIFENFRVCIENHKEVNFDIVDSEPTVYLISESEGSLSLSIRQKAETNEKPFFDMDPGEDISSRVLVDKQNCLIRTFEDFPSQGKTAYEGVVTTYRFLIRTYILEQTSVLEDLKNFCEESSF